jgi:hypothetical protein
MPGPLFVFAFMASTLVGAAFHLFVGGDARRLALFLLCSWFGFAIGQMVAQSLGIIIFPIGSLHILPASLTALGCCIGVQIFTSKRT